MTKENKSFIYEYRIALMEGKTCLPMVWSDNSLHTVITIDEAIKILRDMLGE